MSERGYKRTLNILMQFIQSLYFWKQRKLEKGKQWFSLLLGDNKQKNNIAVLDGVRAIACLLVVFFHVNVISRDGHIWQVAVHPLTSAIVGSIVLAGSSGVTLFFVLSGFLLFLPYAKSLLFGSTWPSTRLFYLRRVFRIVPAYYVALFLIILLFHQEYLQANHWNTVGLFLIFFMDAPQTYQQISGPFWTLAVEWQFYMILPLLALAMSLIVRRGTLIWRGWTLATCLVGVISWGLLSRYWGNYFSAHPTQTFLISRPLLNVLLLFLYGSSGKYLEDFAVGMLICLCYVLLQDRAVDSKWHLRLRQLSPFLLSAGLLVLFFMALWHFNIWYHHYVFHSLDGLFYYYDWLSEFVLSIGFGLSVAAILFGAAWLKRFFEWTPLRWMGLISFSLYMWHVPLLQFFRVDISHQLLGWPHLAVYALYWIWALSVIIPISLLSYVWIEKPWMAIGEKFRRRNGSENAKKEVVAVPANSTTTTMIEPVLVKQ